MFSATQKISFEAEKWVLHQLELLGYNARPEPEFEAKARDIWIDSLPIEVKLSRVNAGWKKLQSGIYAGYPRWQWKVETVDTQDRVLILIAQDSHGFNHPFIMPGALMAHRRVFEINSHPLQYNGILAQYLNNWSIIDYMLNRVWTDGGQLELVSV